MDNVKIDEEEIDSLLELYSQFILEIKKLRQILKDDEQPLFQKYMSYHKLKGMLDIIVFYNKFINYNITIGYNISSPFFQERGAKDAGWDYYKLDDDPFFIMD